jgi:hypothetical protein
MTWIHKMEKWIYLQLRPKLGKEPFSVCLCLSHSSVTVYRKDRTNPGNMYMYSERWTLGSGVGDQPSSWTRGQALRGRAVCSLSREWHLQDHSPVLNWLY